MTCQLCFLLGLLAVASNPSPYFAAFGLVWGAGAGCYMLASMGVTYLSLLLFLMYLGGMMVVFAYSAALVAEPYPEAWGSKAVVKYLVFLGGALGLFWGFFVEVGTAVKAAMGFSIVGNDWWGVCGMFGSGGWLLFFMGWSLLLTLFSVLEVVRGHFSGVLRVV
uniref:NADH-ubiquinone oxidoreductase chain 6 n=1 Tax=Cardioglossa leucomystax TaxID=111122 RepID=S4V0G0_9NEOB|nr:NADH dehydrogenase subunit 6 [Cardioglossa leucomystax]